MPKSNRTLTFEQFAGARRFTPDIGTELGAEGEIGEAGYIYPGDWYINQFDGEFLLIIGNETWKSSNLSELEQVLYTEWYLPESGGIID